jgi:hypothetical protein
MMRGMSFGFSRLPDHVVVVRAPAALGPRVHVRLVVVAQVDEILVALGCARETLDAYVGRTAVTGHREHGHLVGAAHGAQTGRETGGRCCRRRERHVDPGHLNR